ncbi:MAG: CDP-alcohol phosphatidyltransferase family protein [Candidatus Falkowbacteria bacterium]
MSLLTDIFDRKAVPNALTFSRLPFGLLLLFGAWSGWPVWSLLLIFNLGAVTDFLDGYLSRRFDAQTDFGRIFDPVFDKLLMWSGYLLLCVLTKDAVWIVLSALFIFREWLTDGFKGFLLSVKKVVPANRLAKIKTVCQIIMIDGALLYLQFGWPVLYWLAVAVGIVGVIYAFGSAWRYFVLFAMQFPFHLGAGLKYIGTLGLIGYWPFAPNFWAAIISAFALAGVKWLLGPPNFILALAFWLFILVAMSYRLWSISKQWTFFDSIFDPTLPQYFVAGKLPGVLLAIWPFLIVGKWSWQLFGILVAIFVLLNYIKYLFYPFSNNTASAKQLFWADLICGVATLAAAYIFWII